MAVSSWAYRLLARLVSASHLQAFFLQKPARCSLHPRHTIFLIICRKLNHLVGSVVYSVVVLIALKGAIWELLAHALLAIWRSKHHIDAAGVLRTHSHLFCVGALRFKFYLVLTKNLFYREIKLQTRNIFYKIQPLLFKHNIFIELNCLWLC